MDFILYGLRSTGRVFSERNELISTGFIHIFYIPIIPITSIIVSKKSKLLDIGEQIDLYWKSVIAGYTRNLIIPIIVVGLFMIIDGLFFDNVVEKDKLELILQGLFIFSTSFITWCYFMFLYGRKNKAIPNNANSADR